MIGYASRTGTRRNLAVLRDAGWRLLVSARGVLRAEGFQYGIDNGAWTSFREHSEGKRATPQPCLTAFRRAVDRLGAQADFIIVPDIVMGGEASFAMSRYWLRKLRRQPSLRAAKLLFSVQNGMEPERISRWICPRVGIFVGGDTAWKLQTMARWAAVARAKGAICHVGRVNTARRIHLCSAAGVDSFDGSSVSRYAVNLHSLELARQQMDIESFIAGATA